MAKKRSADTELNRDNWDRDDNQDEENQTGRPFPRASDEVLARRNIKVAKRRGGVTTGGNEGPSIFKQFSGFGSMAGETKGPSFNFGSGSTGLVSKPLELTSFNSKPLEATSFKPTVSPSSSNFPKFSFTPSSKPESPIKSSKPESPKASSESPAKATNGCESTKETCHTAYLAHLKVLNEGVLKWVQKHIEQNVNINLVPVFDDYKKHFEELEKRYKPKFTKFSDKKESNSITLKNSESQPPANLPEPKEKPATSIFGATIAKSPQLEELKKEAPINPLLNKDPPKFSFASTDAKSDSTKSMFSFGSSENNPQEKPAFSFGGTSSGFSFGKTGSSETSTFSFGSTTSTNSGFSFGSGLNSKPAETDKKETEEADEDAPPKPEVVEFKEEGSVYDKKCKLFYKKGANFVDKGVGTLFLKPVVDSDKTQLLVRAATTLGNVLLNIMLNPSMPAQRTGKNNVLIVCVPNPPIDPNSDAQTPVTMLLRVKTGEDADELLKKIDELKGKDKK